MEFKHELHLAKITPSDEPLRPFELLRTVIKNPMQIWPAAIYREPLVRWRVFGREMIFVMAPELIHEVLVHQADAFIKGELVRRALTPVLGEAIFTSDGPHWRWQRRAAAPIFRQEAVSGFVSAMVNSAKRTKNRWLSCPPRTELNISHETMRTTFDVILETMLSGHPNIDITRFEEAITRYLESIGWVTAMALLRFPPWMPFPGYLRARQAGNYLKTVISDVVMRCRRRQGYASDLATRLMAATDPESGQSMNDRELADNLLTFIVAGHETTAVALTWAFYLLSLHPQIEGRVIGEIASVTGGQDVRPEQIDALTYTRQVFLEAMRLYPPAPILARTPVSDVRLGTELIPKDTPVYIPIYAIHRHTALWDHPDRFDPDRFGHDAVRARHRYTYIPFGAGPRICIGMSFALTEAVAILATLLQSVRLRLRPDYVPELKMRATLRPAAGMPMLVERR